MKAIYRSIDDSMHEEFSEKWNPDTQFPWNVDPINRNRDTREKRIIPCSRPHSWQDGKEYKLGKDFYVGTGADTNWKDFVYPFSTPSNEESYHDINADKRVRFVKFDEASNEEDELQEELWDEAVGEFPAWEYCSNAEMNELKRTLKSKFHITRK